MFDAVFRKAPFMRVLIPVAGGIMLARQVSMPAWINWTGIGIFMLFLLLVLLLYDVRSKSAMVLSGPRDGLLAVIFQGLFLCMGLVMGREGEHGPVPETLIKARICDEVLEGDRSYKTRLDRLCYLSGGHWKRLEGRVQVYFERDQRCRGLRPGDCISAYGKLLGYDDPSNPFEFDYGAYQRGKGLFYRLYLDSTSWLPARAHVGRGWQIRSKRVRRHLMERMERNIKGEDERAVLYALLLGYREELGVEVKQHFIRSGSMHILAVSGLHVGILYILPAFLIGRIPFSMTGRLLATLFLLVLLWSYALLTGFSPSVVRAVTMCSVHRAAILAGRGSGIFHVLSMTAFLMVVARPPIIFETGFQLSFAAVAGIAAFQKHLLRLIPVKGWLARMTWQLLTVSISAQLGTAPLSVYYFHQFSHAFILSNLAVVPLATVILYAGLAFMVFAAAGLYPVSGILEWLASLLVAITRLGSRMPGAFSENITLVPFQVFLLYLVLLLACLFLSSRRFIWLQGLMVTAALWFLFSGIRAYRIRSQEGCYVFAIPRQTAISFVQGKEHALYRGGRMGEDSLQVPYALRNFCARHQLSPPVFLHASTPGQAGRSRIHLCRFDAAGAEGVMVLFKECRMVILRRWPDHLAASSAVIKTDVLVLVDSAPCNPFCLMDVFKPGLVIVDGSSHPGYHAQVERACQRHGISFHSTEKDGFYAF